MSSDFTLHTKSNGDVHIHGQFNDPQMVEVGKTIQFRFYFPSYYDTLLVADSHTVSEAEFYAKVVVNSGATLTIPNGTTLTTETVDNNGTIDNNGTLIVHNHPTEALDGFNEWAGQFTAHGVINGTQKYRENIPSTAAIDTLLVGIEPSNTLQSDDIHGVWGLVEDFNDARDPVLSPNKRDVSIQVLAEFGNYTDHTAVENDLQI